MATQTTNLHLTKPDYTDAADIAVINTNMDTLDAKVGAVGNTSLQAQVTAVEGRVTTVEDQIGTVPSGKTLQGQITDNATAITNVDSDITSAMAIVVDGDTAPQNITQGSYVYIKNHSTLDTGMYHATSAISEDADITSSNVTADSDGIANALNSKLEWTFIDYKQGTTSIALPADAKEYLFVLRFGTSGGGQPLCFEFTVPNSASLWNGMTLTDGYYNAANAYGFGQVTYYQGTHAANMALMSINGVNYSSTSYLYAFYR